MLFIIILILSLIAGFITPWWVTAIICFIMALYAGKTPSQSFWSGFLAIFIVWLVLILFKTVPNDHVLASRVTVLLHLKRWYLLLSITALTGGVVGGMSALSGLMVKRLFAGK